MHFTSRKLFVDFVQGAFLELLINSDLGLKTKPRAENSCELFTGREGCFRSRSVSVRGFFSAVFSTSKRVSVQCGSSYLPVDRTD